MLSIKAEPNAGDQIENTFKEAGIIFNKEEKRGKRNCGQVDKIVDK